ncbi:MAG: hypothetical protein EXS48_03435 [Candidatus Staskawiczbacteria bacterium]|nr:hypothetical protein [Candidatus Staskawiczbacteria bacterium]
MQNRNELPRDEEPDEIIDATEGGDYKLLENSEGVLEFVKKEGAKVQESRENPNLDKYYTVLKSEKSKFKDLKEAISQILEKNSNKDDCFWISHAWAESLMQGKTISKNNFPSEGILVRSDALWKKGTSDYKGIHVSYGADESYLITDWTKGEKHDLQERTYNDLKQFSNVEELEKYIEKINNGQLIMILIDCERMNNEKGHVLLMTKINDIPIAIDNSMQPGAWIHSWKEFSEMYGAESFLVYNYPEKIYSMESPKP